MYLLDELLVPGLLPPRASAQRTYEDDDSQRRTTKGHHGLPHHARVSRCRTPPPAMACTDEQGIERGANDSGIETSWPSSPPYKPPPRLSSILAPIVFYIKT